MKRAIISLAASAVIMFLSLWLTVTYVAGNDGLGVLMLLFFALYPLTSVAVGIVGGTKIKSLWYIPLVNAAFYLASSWIFLEAFEVAFLGYAAVYAVIGLAAAGVTALITNRKKEKPLP